MPSSGNLAAVQTLEHDFCWQTMSNAAKSFRLWQNLFAMNKLQCRQTEDRPFHFTLTLSSASLSAFYSFNDRPTARPLFESLFSPPIFEVRQVKVVILSFLQKSVFTMRENPPSTTWRWGTFDKRRSSGSFARTKKISSV